MYPKRSITDTLAQGFFQDIKWSGQELDQALFSKAYTHWWNQVPVQGLDWVLFAILLLRVCCIGSAFLQSETSTNEQIIAIGTSKVAAHCDQLAHRIQTLIQDLPGTKSVLNVQIIYLEAFYHSIQGQLETAWYTLSNAIRIIQYIGINANPQGVQITEQLSSDAQSRHLVFMNVLIMDSILCFFLDRPPTVTEKHFIELQSVRAFHQNNTNLASELGPCTERILQAKLWQIWTSMKENSGSRKSKSIPSQVEHRYRRFRESFIDQLPSAFNLDHPDTQWDRENSMLIYQRQWLHVNVLMVQCGILQDSLLLGHAETMGLSEHERSMTNQHVKLLARNTSALREVFSSLYSLSGSTKGATSILRPFVIRSAILAGLSFISIRSMQAGSRSSRSWPDFHSEESISLEACKSHIQETLALLMASSGDSSTENEMRSLQAILARMEDFSAGNVDFDVARNDMNPQQFFEDALIGGAPTMSKTPDFSLLASSDLLGSIASFTGPPFMGSAFQDFQGLAMAFNLDDSTPFTVPMLDIDTEQSTPSTTEHHSESNISSITLDATCDRLLSDTVNIFH